MSDHNLEAVGEYNVEMPEFAAIKGYSVAKRVISILDERGVICDIWVTEDPALEPDYVAI